jgi:uncharacterized membrane protein
MPELIAFAYAEETVAGQAADELERRADELAIDLDAIGLIVRERNGSYQLAASHHAGATAAWSRFWGVLFGVLTGETETTAIDVEFRRQIRNLLKPGTSMLLVALERVSPEMLAQAVSQYGGTSLTCPLSADGTSELWETLDGELARAQGHRVTAQNAI